MWYHISFKANRYTWQNFCHVLQSKQNLWLLYITCMTSKDSDQPVHPPRVARFLVHPSLDSPDAVEGTCGRGKFWSDCVYAQADLNLRWSHKSYCRFCRALAQMLFEILTGFLNKPPSLHFIYLIARLSVKDRIRIIGNLHARHSHFKRIVPMFWPLTVTNKKNMGKQKVYIFFCHYE